MVHATLHPAAGAWVRRSLLAAAALAALAAVAACAPGVTIDARVGAQIEVAPAVSGSLLIVRIPASRPAGGITVRPAQGRAFNIPPGHYPPPGQCRIWHPNRPPGLQSPPGRCDELDRQVPPGAYLVYG
jgi:hypothetical protein